MKTHSEARQEQIDVIKKRLNAEYEKYSRRGGTINSLRNLLNEEQNFELNYDTLRKTLNPNDKGTLDFFCVLALCRYWKLDTAYILSPPSNTESPMPSAESLTSSAKFTVLNDPHYLGTYYGFVSSNKPDNSDLHRICLKIDDFPSGFTASLTIERDVTYTDGHTEILKRQLHGTPILSTLNNNISILLTDDIGNFFFLYMEYQKHLSQNMYYRKGIAVTSASTSEREPVMQTFLLFDIPVPKEKLSYIPGLLLPPQEVFPISETETETLKAEHPLLAKFFDEFSYLLEHNKENVYRINETVILHEHSQMPKEERIKALLLLKEKALAESQFFYTPNNDYSEFSKNYLHCIE